MATAEPVLRFVVQLHRARRLHYDLRFEMDGVLASWAVPRGPTLDPTVRRSAIHVDDHPLEYLDFEGVIPAGTYGGGDVVVWDVGTWEPHGTDDPTASVAAGELHAEVYGHKLRGRLVLIRTGQDRSGREQSGKEQWLLLHKRDGYAVEGWRPEDHPRSVLSGRTSDEVKADPERMWRSDLPAAQASIALRGAVTGRPDADRLAALDGLGDRGTWDVFGRRLRLTNLDREVLPARGGESAVTKRELIRYSALVAPTVLPYLAGRALDVRLPRRAPDWLPRWENSAVVDEGAALVWVANFGITEWRPSTSRTDAPRSPTYALIDIGADAAASWGDVLVLARLYRTALEHLHIRAWPKVSGDGGIEVWVPIARGPTFEEAWAWVDQVSQAVGAVAPDLIDHEPDRRPSTVAVAPYSPRASAGAPVSVPIDWEELDNPALAPAGLTIRNVLDRLATTGDPFRPLLATEQQLPRIR